MRRFVPLILAVLLLGAVIPVLAVSESAPEDLDHNRRLLERYHTDPEHYKRLVSDLRSFQALPPERQEAMRQLDHDLHEEDPETQSHLWEVLERYSDWVGRLQESEQRRLDAAGDPTERLTVIRDLRQKEWIDRLPKADRDALLSLTEPARALRVSALRKEERQRRSEWRDWANAVKTRPDLGARTNRPARLADFPAEVRTFVADQLTPILSDDEKEHWKRAAQGRWPRLADAILELSERHPVLPPLPTGPIVKYDQLPAEAKKNLVQDRPQKQGGELQKKEGKWPQYALAVVDLMKQEKRTPPPLGASRPAEFSAEVREFIGKLKDTDQTKLHELEGRWPEYPLALLEIGRKNNLIVPGMSLPGPRDLWDNARTALPDVPDRVLAAFGQSELSPEARATLAQAGDDQAERREILKQEYFKTNPHELQRLRRLDRRGSNVNKP